MAGMLSKADSKLIHALKTRKGREKHGLFTVEGVRVVEDLLDAGIDLVWAVVSTTQGDTARHAALREQLRRRTDVREVDERTLMQIADTETPQGVLAVARIPEKKLTDVRVTDNALLLVLDAVQDPGNVGTLIRSADAFGASAVIGLPGTVDFWNSKVIRSAAGSAFRLPLVNAADDETWSWLAKHDVAICGADMEGTPVTSWQRPARLALAVGNEGAGLRTETRGQVAQMVSIPMRGGAESLNVAVAAGILLYEISKQG